MGGLPALRLIRRVLIANRGEIAVRIMRTCRALGIETVAVYSDADRRALHVRCADQAVAIGPAPSRESYLRIDTILDAARRTSADAIHPGYGFLAENADFAEACEQAGITFLGPQPQAIRKMGSKRMGKEIAAHAGVPIVPGSLHADLDTARKIGFPVLIKASAGGGGRGMRLVRTEAEFADALAAAGREAESAFGDGRLLLERYLEGARHIEVQIAGDLHGNLIHLYERECSVQRRHQKLIEESPSPAVDAELRYRLGESAVAIGRALNYTSLGTVEFLVAPNGEFFFIEANTRIQVEHPVTELLTGIDLVELQIAIAEGRPLTFEQHEVPSNGHAIEARLCAEDPDNDFLPATGEIVRWSAPPGIRVDTAIESGTQVSIYYDSLLAKLIAHAPSRGQAIRKLTAALRDTVAHGVVTNRRHLIHLLEHPDFQAGRVDTHFVAHAGTAPPAMTPREACTLAALWIDHTEQARRPMPTIPPHYRNNPVRPSRLRLSCSGQTFDVALDGSGPRVIDCADGVMRVEHGGIVQPVVITMRRDTIFVAGSVVTREPRYPESPNAVKHETANSPMPGQVLRIAVSEGQTVSPGDALVVLEAMKMEQTIRTTIQGVVERILVHPGEVVAPGQMLVEIGSPKE